MQACRQSIAADRANNCSRKCFVADNYPKGSVGLDSARTENAIILMIAVSLAATHA